MFKRTVAIAASAAVIGLLVTPSAHAAGPDALSGYAAGSSATSLVINLVDQSLALSATTAAVSSEGPDDATAGPTAAADGAALLVAGTPVPSGAPSQTPGGQPSNSVTAVSVDLGDATQGAADGLTADLGKVDTTGTVTDGAPAATSGAAETGITVTGLGGEVLTPLLEPLEALLTDTLETATPTVEETVCGLLSALLCEDDAIVDLPGAVDELIEDIGALDDQAFTVAQVVVGASVSQARANATDGVVAEAGSTATRIDLFPGLAASLQTITGLIPGAPAEEPLLSVVLGNATAKVVRDPVDGKAEPDASAAQLLDIDLHDSLGILDEVLGEQVPALVDTLAEAGAALSCDGGALAQVICVDLGQVNELDADELTARGYDFGEGTVGREASAAHLEVLSVLGDVVGGQAVLSLDLAQASAAANAVPAAPPAAPEEPQQPPLPRTGGGVNAPLALGLFAAAVGGIAIVRRTRTV